MADLTPQVEDCTRRRGDTVPFNIQVTSGGSPVDITGYSFRLVVDPSEAPVDDSNELFEVAGTITDAVNGRVSFPISTANADNVGNYFYEVEQTDASSLIRTILAGEWNFTQDVAK